jgi:hypothetical protein
MAKFSGRMVDLGIAREIVRGTPVAPSFWVPRQELSFDDKVAKDRQTSGIGTLDDSYQTDVTTKWAEGTISGEVRQKMFGLWLYSLFGTCTSSGAVDSLYTHTFTLEDTCQHDSLTLTVVDPNTTDQYRNCMVSKMELTAGLDKVLQYSVDIIGRTSKGSSGTPAFAAENKFNKTHLSVKVGPTIAGLATASSLSMKALTFTISQDVVPDDFLGTAEPEDFLNRKFSVEGKLTLNYESATWKEYVRGNTYMAMELKWTDTDHLVGAGSYSALTFQMPRVDFYEWTPNYALDEISSQEISFKANYDLTNTLAAISTCTLANTQVSY